MGLQRSLASWAVQPLADDEQDPSLAVLLTLSDETVHLALGLSDGVAMQITLRLHLELRVLEGVEDARMRGAPLPEDDFVALTLHHEWLVKLPLCSPGYRFPRSRACRRWHHALSRARAQRFHVGEGSLKGLSIEL